jgi:YggT family protein
LLQSLSAPVLRPFQRLIPPIAGIDLSALFALIAIQAVQILLNS